MTNSAVRWVKNKINTKELVNISVWTTLLMYSQVDLNKIWIRLNLIPPYHFASREEYQDSSPPEVDLSFGHFTFLFHMSSN